MSRFAALVILVFLAASGAAAQVQRDAPRFGEPHRLPPLDQGSAVKVVPAPGIALITSAILPGAGQYLLGQERWIPYVVLEAWAVVSYFDRRRDGLGFERQYKDLAWSVARRVSSGERRDTTWEYYESLAHFDASGAYDADPRPGVFLPEQDAATYNGMIWRLSRSLYLPGGGPFPVESAEYQRALAHYMRHAIPPSFAWAWGASRLEQQAYSDLIRESDESFRAATQLLGIMVANHIVSAVDALVTAKLRMADSPLRLRLRGEPDAGAGGQRWAYSIQVFW